MRKKNRKIGLLCVLSVAGGGEARWESLSWVQVGNLLLQPVPWFLFLPGSDLHLQNGL